MNHMMSEEVRNVKVEVVMLGQKNAMGSVC
jgi:hypothetical protein